MPASSLGQRDVPQVSLSCCSFKQHLYRSGYIKTYKTCHSSPPRRRFFYYFKFYLKEQNQEKRKKLHPSGQMLFVPGHPDFHMGMLSWQKSFLAVRQPRRFMVFSLLNEFCSNFSFFLGMLLLLQNGPMCGNVHFRGCYCALGDNSVFPETRFTPFLLTNTRKLLVVAQKVVVELCLAAIF